MGAAKPRTMRQIVKTCSPRARTALTRLGAFTVEQLAGIDLDRAASLRNVGAYTLHELEGLRSEARSLVGGVSYEAPDEHW